MSNINKFVLSLLLVIGGLFTLLFLPAKDVNAQTCSGNTSVTQENSACITPVPPYTNYTCNEWTDTDTPSCQWDWIPSCGPIGNKCACGRWWFTRFTAACFGLPGSCTEESIADTEWYDSGCTIGGGCTCGAWNNQSCGGGSCPAWQRLQTRNCNPGGCAAQSKCVDDASCGVLPPPCSVTAPTSPSMTNLTGTSVRLNWTPGSGGTIQPFRLGPNRTEVETGCPGGVGPGLGCLVGTSLAVGTSTYNTGNILTPNTTYYWRAVEYNGANGDYKDFGNICKVASSVSFVTPIPSCTVNSYLPSPVNVPAGETRLVTVNVTPLNGTIDRVDFSIDNVSRATVNPASDTTVPYQTVVTGVTPGSTILRASVYMGGVLRCGGAAPVATVNVGNPISWWQITDADVITNGNLVSPIPGTCTLPACDPVFVKEGPGNSPGVPLYAGSYDFSAGVGQGIISDNPPWGWHANTSFSAVTQYVYDFFYRLVPGDAVRNVIASDPINPNELKTQGAVSPDTYKWYFRTGNLTMRGEPTLASTKVILFVDGNLTIDGHIDITPGTGFFMAIASGNITVNPGVRNPVGGYDLEGIFVADGNFVTASAGAGLDEAIQIRGMVAAYGAVDPNRDLPDNTQAPAEEFTYAPDLLFNYPSSLTLKRTRWKEITP